MSLLRWCRCSNWRQPRACRWASIGTDSATPATLRQVLDKKEADIISFPVFAAGVNACLIYEEFFEHAEHVFNACDVEGKGFVEPEVFFSILRQMNTGPTDIQGPEGWTIPSHQLIDSASEVLQLQSGTGAGARISYKDFILTIVKVMITRGDQTAA